MTTSATETLRTVELHDTVRTVDTILVDRFVRMYVKGDTVFRDSIRSVYVRSMADNIRQARADSVRTENATKTERVVQYETPGIVWIMLIILVITVITLSLWLKLNKKKQNIQ